MSFTTKIKEMLVGRPSILDSKVIEANNIGEIKKVFGWKNDPSYERADIHEYEYLEDINERRIRDAEVIGHAMCNVNAKTALEIGTSTGMMTVLMAKNAPGTMIHTINIPPEDIVSGKGGVNTTIALEEAEIGKEYKCLELKNITQVYENTATWTPNIGQIDIAFIDGSHDTDFVYNDTIKILPHMPSGSFILWHDFNPGLRKKFHWIDDVCKGIELLYKDRHIKGQVLLLKDSWIGIYRVP